MKYQLIRDYYLVKVDSIWESSTTKSGIITSNTAIQNNVEELEDRGEFKRRYGIVVEVPASFSDNALEMIDPGTPAPKKYVGHEWIQQMIHNETRGFRKHERPQDKYYPSTFEEYETIKMSDIGKLMDVKKGDKVYFDHKSTDLERDMGKFEDGHMFAICVNEIICTVKEVPIFEGYNSAKRMRIHPQGGWALVKINMESWDDITTESGVIVKVCPEALPLQGTIVSAKNFAVGTKVLFERNADAPIIVEGHDLTCMKEDEILATLKK